MSHGSYEDFFMHNWAQEVVVRTRWQTSIDVSHQTLAEDRVGLLDRPGREITFQWRGITKREAWRCMARLHDAGFDGILVPLYCDQAETTAASPAAGNTLNCPTTDRRFAVGGQCVAFARGTDGRVSFMQSFEITAIGAATLTVDPVVATEFPAGAVVMPAFFSDEVPESNFVFRSDGKFDVALTVGTQPDPDWAVFPPSSTPGTNPAGFDTFGGLPIFDLEPDWSDGVSFGVVRAVDRVDLGRGTARHQRGGAKSQFTFAVSMLQLTRAEAMDMVDFFDSRGGAYCPFYMAHPVAMFEPTEFNVGYVDVEAYDTDEDWLDANLTHLAVVMKDGTHYIRAVSSVTQNADEWRIAVATNLPAIDAADVARVAPAYLMRFQEDVLSEEWLTDDKVRMGVSMIQVLDETTAEA